MKFCENKFCRCHVEVPEGLWHLKYVEANGRAVTVQRKKIIDPVKKKEFDFCEICAYAVALVNE